jgi:hypothetical protein
VQEIETRVDLDSPAIKIYHGVNVTVEQGGDYLRAEVHRDRGARLVSEGTCWVIAFLADMAILIGVFLHVVRQTYRGRLVTT